MRQIFIISLILCLSGCSNDSKDISDRLAQQVEGNSVQIDLQAVLSSPWDRMCVVGPYATNETAEKILGFPWNLENASNKRGNDGFYLMVFVKGKKVVAFADHPRNKGDLIGVQPSCLARKQAFLQRRVVQNGWVQLETFQSPAIGVLK